jgi:hypothetical protein
MHDPGTPKWEAGVRRAGGAGGRLRECEEAVTRMARERERERERETRANSEGASEREGRREGGEGV